MTSASARRAARLGFWCLLVASYVVAIWPRGIAVGGSDKLHHLLAFAALSLSARLAYPATPPLVPLAGLALFGGLIELTQALPALGRRPELLDWVADMAGVLIGLAIAAVMLRRFVRR